MLLNGFMSLAVLCLRFGCVLLQLLSIGVVHKNLGADEYYGQIQNLCEGSYLFVIRKQQSSRFKILKGKRGNKTMKATGIVRRIDDLGRVVIPKEIRRTLRIREGDPLEIFVDRDGEVILKKYSPIGELGDFAKEYAESLFESTGHVTLITDRDTIITVAGASKKELMDKQIGATLESCMDNRKTIIETNSGGFEIVKGITEEYSSYVAAPIIAGGDPIGTVVLLSKDESVKMSEMETKMAETAAGFLAKQMEQ